MPSPIAHIAAGYAFYRLFRAHLPLPAWLAGSPSAPGRLVDDAQREHLSAPGRLDDDAQKERLSAPGRLVRPEQKIDSPCAATCNTRENPLPARTDLTPAALVFLLAATVFFALLPDADALPGLLSRDFGRFHNNVSHSLFFCLAASAAAGLLARSAIGRGAGRWWFAFCLAASATHVAMDFFTIGRGVMALWPLVHDRLVPPFFLFYGVNWSLGWTSHRHLITIFNELTFVAILAFIRRALFVFWR